MSAEEGRRAGRRGGGLGQGMEVQQGRPMRTTLYGQLSAAALELPSSGSKHSTSSSSPNLGDLLKFRQDEDLHQLEQPARSRRSASISLGTFLACEKRELPSRSIATFASTAAVSDGIGGRTLLDVIRDEDQESRGSGGGVYDDALVGCANNRHRISWRRAFKERLRILRPGNPVDGVSDEGTVLPSPAAPSSPEIPVQDDRPARAGAGDVAQPTGLSARVGASDFTRGGDGSGRGGGGPPAPAAGTAEEGRQQDVQPVRVSLMTLLDQTDMRRGGGAGFAVSALLEEDQDQDQEEGGGGGGERGKKKYNAGKCCVCMVRHKGAAFIPCGHTFCRLCCRKLWVSRGSCPLCNGFILEVLDIF